MTWWLVGIGVGGLALFAASVVGLLGALVTIDKSLNAQTDVMMAVVDAFLAFEKASAKMNADSAAMARKIELQEEIAAVIKKAADQAKIKGRVVH